jgi:hypothetical protein
MVKVSAPVRAKLVTTRVLSPGDGIMLIFAPVPFVGLVVWYTGAEVIVTDSGATSDRAGGKPIERIACTDASNAIA